MLWQGAAVSASDISQAMADEASRCYETAVAEGGRAPPVAPKFATSDLESLRGRFHTVCCLDVLIHYPQAKSCYSYYLGVRPCSVGKH